eukprot:gene8416-17342_t
MQELDIVDLNIYLKFSGDSKDNIHFKKECTKAATSLQHFGCVLLNDPRVAEENNNLFLDMMELYFSTSDGQADAHPEVHYQVGVTPALIERPRNHCTRMGTYGPDNKPLSPCPPELDPKWRFFWRVGPRPTITQFPSQNAEQVIPIGFPQWSEVMDMWGQKMLDALTTLSAMIAIGFDLPEDSFTSRMQCGPHLLAPTGSDLNGPYGIENTVLAGYHYDLNFLTIHGKSRYPGLFIWTRDGRRVPVKVPTGCLLVQAGKQMEYLTGGHVLAGFHEVVVSSETTAAINQRRAANHPLWRVSSTCFGHIQSDQILEPLGHFKTVETVSTFPPILAGHQVQEELRAISLDKSK